MSVWTMMWSFIMELTNWIIFFQFWQLLLVNIILVYFYFLYFCRHHDWSLLFIWLFVIEPVKHLLPLNWSRLYLEHQHLRANCRQPTSCLSDGDEIMWLFFILELQGATFGEFLIFNFFWVSWAHPYNNQIIDLAMMPPSVQEKVYII